MSHTSLVCDKNSVLVSVNWNVLSIFKCRCVHHFALRGQDCLSWFSIFHARFKFLRLVDARINCRYTNFGIKYGTKVGVTCNISRWHCQGGHLTDNQCVVIVIFSHQLVSIGGHSFFRFLEYCVIGFPIQLFSCQFNGLVIHIVPIF